MAATMEARPVVGGPPARPRNLVHAAHPDRGEAFIPVASWAEWAQVGWQAIDPHAEAFMAFVCGTEPTPTELLPVIEGYPPRTTTTAAPGVPDLPHIVMHGQGRYTIDGVDIRGAGDLLAHLHNLGVVTVEQD